MRMAVEMDIPRPLESAAVNPAPAMVSDKISLHKLHTMFSLLNLKRSFVVSGGKLVGIVSIHELTRGNYDRSYKHSFRIFLFKYPLKI